MSLPAGNVLIVEDDPDLLEILATLLTAEGFHSVSAEDGLEAIHLLRAVRHRAPGVPCLVLLDLNMPRFSGSAFRSTQLADPNLANVPVVVMSGVADIEQQASALGATASITKPVDFDALLAIVRRHCA